MLFTNKFKKSTIILVFLSLPALLIIINNSLISRKLVEMDFVSGKKYYEKSYWILPTTNKYCISIYLPKSDFTTSFTGNKEELYSMFDFDWTISNDDALISEGRGRPLSFITAWAPEKIYFEFACFKVNPFKKYLFKFNLKNFPKEESKKIDRGVKITIDSDQIKSLMAFSSLAYAWLLL